MDDLAMDTGGADRDSVARQREQQKLLAPTRRVVEAYDPNDVVTSEAAEQKERRHRNVTTTLMALARVFERIDEGVLPSVYLYVGCALHTSAAQLGAITFCRAVVQALTSCLGGVAGHYLNRARVVAVSCVLWAACTALFTLCTSVGPAMLVWGINGFALALMVPNSQSLVADFFPAHQRGKAFGMLLSVGSIGTMLGTLFATNMGGRTIAGIEGWRVAFIVIAALSALLGVVIWVLARDPRCAANAWLPMEKQRHHLPGGGTPALSTLVSDIKRVISTPSFVVIILQGVFGSMPWTAFAYVTLYLQLLGWPDAAASAVLAIFSVGTAIGAVLGGVVGDAASTRFPNSGRIAVTQFSVGIGVPLSAFIFQGLPRTSGLGVYAAYATTCCFMGILINWAATACNNPVFAEVVPVHLRTLIYAFDRSFEGSLSALAAPLVGLTAERWFHFGTAAVSQDCSGTSAGAQSLHKLDAVRASALAAALTLFSVIPWTFCALCYTPLYWTYPRDRQPDNNEVIPPVPSFSPLRDDPDMGLELVGDLHAPEYRRRDGGATIPGDTTIR